MMAMEQETIQEDVSGEALEGVNEPEAKQELPGTDPVSRREQRMAEISERAREGRETDRKAAALMNDPDLTEDEYDSRQKRAAEPEAEIEEEGEEEAKPVAPKESNGWVTAEDGTRTKQLKVNGQVVELTEEEYDRRLQKDLAGEDKLRRASQLERELAQRAQQISEREQRLQSQTLPTQQGAEMELERALSEYHDALLDGETDVARQKLMAVMQSGRQSPTPNIDDITAQVTTRVEQQQEQRRQVTSMQQGWDKFKTDYSDIAADDGLLAYADTQVKRLRQERPDLTPGEIILEAGRYTRERLSLGGQKPAAPAADTTTRDERLAAKSTIKPLPKASGSRYQAPVQERVDHSPAAKIARMRAGRKV